MYHEAQGLDVTAQKTLGTTCTLPQSLHPDPSAPGSQVRKGVTKKKLLSVVASFEVEGSLDAPASAAGQSYYAGEHGCGHASAARP